MKLLGGPAAHDFGLKNTNLKLSMDSLGAYFQHETSYLFYFLFRSRLRQKMLQVQSCLAT
jgi:hypothetical protein